MKPIIKYFFSGVLFLVPIAITVYIFIKAFLFLDGLLINVKIPGVGLITTLLVVTIFGYLTSNLITKKFFHYFDSILHRLPLVNLVYSSVKDVIGAFVGDKKSFDKPVMVTIFPGSEAKVLGFITRESTDNFGLANHVAVYLPQSYNFAGNVLLFPREQVEILDADSSAVMTFIVSAGIAGNK